MKHQPFHLKIPSPCSEDWSAMHGKEARRFCDSCKKQVVDFTRMSEGEISEFLKQSSGKVCGRLTENQLKHRFDTSASSHLLLAHAFSGMLLMLAAGATAEVTAKPEMELVEFTSKEDAFSMESGPNDSLAQTIKGRILDAETKEPLLFANVWIKGTKHGIATDENGEFQLSIPDSLGLAQFTVIVSYLGYENGEFTFASNDLPITEKEFQLNSASVLMGEIYIVVDKKWWQFWKRRQHKH